MWPLIALAAQKRHLSLYVCAVVDGGYLAEARADRLGKVSCGKSCIRFTSLDAVDADGARARWSGTPSPPPRRGTTRYCGLTGASPGPLVPGDRRRAGSGR